ncbi:MAG: type transporter [Deltaproteobacteria bacterium]|jgi:ABC-2 type transport system permease protein|nr:type transporter [Deltaproteobacteria bacterium]
MIRQIIAITLKELKVLWLDREALALLFAMPMFFILVMSFALEGVFEAGSKGHPIEILVVHQDGGRLAEQAIADLKRMEGLILIETYEGIPLSSDKAEQLIGRGVYPLALLFPEGYTEKILKNANDPQKGKAIVYLISDPAMNLQLLATVKGAVQGAIERRVLLARIPQRLKEMFGTLGGTEGQLDNMLEDPNISERGRSGVDFIHTFPKGFNAGRRPTATEQNVPAYTIFGVFFIVLTLASSFLQEKKDGTFQRILAAPLSKTALLIGKLLPYYLVNLIQIALMFCIGVVVFGMKLGHLPALVIVSLALAAAANGLGLLVAALGKTEAQVNGLSVLLAITLSALGGMMVPTFIMPNLMKTLSLFTPHAWALAGYHDIIIRGLGIKDVLTEMFVLLGFASFFFVIALWRFRFDK